MNLWAKIWSLEDQGELVRSYIADYELYDEQSMDPQNAVVEVHIGIK
jgi:predicted transcriptional regulator YdeE